jgi:ABC-type antimicrobial peptide transport system permease subunit
LVVFGVAAAVLAAVGIFGVTARAVAQRTRELGIRMALGAGEAGLVGMVFKRSLSIGLGGTALGLLGAFWASRLLSGFLFGVDARDPITYGSVSLLVVIMCLAASYLPARRTAKVDPVTALRAE